MDETSLSFWIKRSIGVALALTVLGYIGYVTVTFGVSNPDRPRTRREIEKKLIQYAGKTQDTDKIYKDAIEKAKEMSDSFFSILLDGIKEEGLYELNRHRQIAGGQEKPPEGFLFDLETFKNDAPEDERLQFLGIRWSKAEEQFVYYKPSVQYCAIAAANLPIDEVVRGYLDHLDMFEWAFDRALYDPNRGVATLTAIQDSWHLSLDIWSGKDFPECQTVIHWYVSKSRMYDEFDDIE